MRLEMIGVEADTWLTTFDNIYGKGYNNQPGKYKTVK
jgi:hypothetical protein